MKILKIIQRAFSKTRRFAHGKTASSGELTEKYFELMREEEKRLEAQGLPALELIKKMDEFDRKRNGMF